MKSLRRLILGFARDTSGTALVEMAIVLPVALLLMAGVVDFGMAFSAQATLGKAARDAGRYLAGVPAGASCQSSARTKAESLVPATIWSQTVTVAVDCSDCPAPTLPGGILRCVQVKVSAPYDPLMLGAFLPAVSQFNLSAQHREAQVGG